MVNKVNNKKGGASYKFYQLDIWKEGYRLLMEAYKVVENFPPEEKFALVTQLIKAANSVIANIAEAHGRYFYADKIRVLYIARGEVQETQSHLAVAWGRKYIDSTKFQNLSRRYEKLKVGINNYINSINEKQNKQNK